MIKHYAKMIKDKEMTPKQAAQSYVMQLLWNDVEEWKQQGIDNTSEKKFVVAVSQIHNQQSHSFNKNGDSIPIEIDQIKIES